MPYRLAFFLSFFVALMIYDLRWLSILLLLYRLLPIVDAFYVRFIQEWVHVCYFYCLLYYTTEIYLKNKKKKILQDSITKAEKMIGK